MRQPGYPENLARLHQGEELIRTKSIDVIEADQKMMLHTEITEAAMDLLDMFRQLSTQDEDLKVMQMLGLRQFNALASATKLMLGGYYQTSALVLRDVLETVFLIDFFRTERPAITRWRLSDKRTRLREFKPIKIREQLDQRDGFTDKKRAEIYSLFSELAGHPSMASVAMLRPRGMDARNGPFLDQTALQAVLSEMGRLAVQVGETTGAFLPSDRCKDRETLVLFNKAKLLWIREFYPNSTILNSSSE